MPVSHPRPSRRPPTRRPTAAPLQPTPHPPLLSSHQDPPDSSPEGLSDIRQIVNYFAHAPIDPKLKRTIKCPVLILAGGGDEHASPSSAAEDWKAQFDKAELYVLNDAVSTQLLLPGPGVERPPVRGSGTRGRREDGG